MTHAELIRLVLSIAFIAVQAWDVLSTNRFLKVPGWTEANPINRAAQTKLGSAWWVVKIPELAVLAAIWAWLPANGADAVLFILCLLYTINNLRNDEAGT